jgi:hypothetical protein
MRRFTDEEKQRIWEMHQAGVRSKHKRLAQVPRVKRSAVEVDRTSGDLRQGACERGIVMASAIGDRLSIG